MTPPRICSVLVAIAMIHGPFVVKAQMIAVNNCNGGMSLLVIPGDDKAPGKQGGGDCAKACHAMCERRGKNAANRGGPASA